MTRRKFLAKALRISALLGCAGLAAVPVLRFITFRAPRRKMVIFSLQDQPAPVRFKENVFLLTRADDAQALSARCPHLGCTLQYDERRAQFRCPCHGSVFDHSGNRIAGPAPRDMDTLSLDWNEKGDAVVTVLL